MAGLAAMVAILGIFSTIAFQEYAEVLRRDREAEMMFRAREIVRAIQRYRKDRGGAAPQKLEDLAEPGSRGQYFIRRLYDDPLVANHKWGLLYVGPGNQIVDPSAQDEATQATLGALSGQQGLGGFNRGQRAGSGGADSSSPVRPGRPDGAARAADLGRPEFNRGRFGSGEAQGLPIAGVKTLCTDKPFRVYNGLSEYKEWLFTYFDLENPQGPGGNRQNPQGGNSQRDFPGSNPGSNPPRNDPPVDR